jgi:hypothetical protein
MFIRSAMTRHASRNRTTHTLTDSPLTRRSSRATTPGRRTLRPCVANPPRNTSVWVSLYTSFGIISPLRCCRFARLSRDTPDWWIHRKRPEAQPSFADSAADPSADGGAVGGRHAGADRSVLPVTRRIGVARPPRHHVACSWSTSSNRNISAVRVVVCRRHRHQNRCRWSSTGRSVFLEPTARSAAQHVSAPVQY